MVAPQNGKPKEWDQKGPCVNVCAPGCAAYLDCWSVHTATPLQSKEKDQNCSELSKSQLATLPGLNQGRE